MNNQYIDLGKIKFTVEGLFDSTKSYDELSIVFKDGYSYVSKQAVPVGTELTDENYWQLLIDVNDKFQPINDNASKYNSLSVALLDTIVEILNDNLNGDKTHIIEIPSATKDTAGVMSAEDKANLDRSFHNVLEDIQADYINFWFQANGTDGVEIDIPAATVGGAGVMSAKDKNKLERLKESVDILKGEYSDIVSNIINLTKNLNALSTFVEAEESKRVEEDSKLKNDTVSFDSFNTNSSTKDKVVLKYKNFNQDKENVIEIPAATKEYAGVMSAEDKERLDKSSYYTYNIPVDKKGYYIRSDGEIIQIGESPHFCVSQFIEVIEGDIFIIENATELSSTQSYALYDSDKNFVSSSNLANVVVRIPENVRYIVFSRNTIADAANNYKCRSVFNKYFDVLLYLGDKSLYNNYATFINTTGNFIRDLAPQYISTDYIDIVPSQVLFIKGKAENKAVLYAFYTKDKVLISTGIKEGVVVAPENAYFLAACSDNKVEYYIKALTTEYTDYKIANYIEPLNTKVGNTNFYKHRANIGHSIGATIPNYILINVPNSQNTICGIQFKIATFKLTDFSQKNINVLAYFYPTETTKGLSYASVQVQGDTALDIKYLIKDGSFYIAIPKGTILNSYSGIYVDSLYSWFSAPTISNDSDNIIISEEANIDNYNIVYEYSYTPPKAINKVTDLENIYQIHNHLEGNYPYPIEYLVYPVADYGSWSEGQTGACVIKFPAFDNNQCFFELDINVFRYQTKGCTFKVSGFYTTDGFQGGKFVRVVSGSLDTIYSKLRVGYHDNRICIILGDTTNTWRFLKFDISNVRTYMNSGKPTPFTEGWDLEFVSDLTNYNVENVDYKIDEELIPSIPVSKIIGVEDLKTISLSEYCNPHYIRTKLNDFYKKLYKKEKNTPYNLLFLGDSIVNFQNGWVSGADKALPDVSNDKPLCMYNPYTWTNRLWALLNPNAVDKANRDSVFGGNMTFIKATNDAVVRTGTWINSYNYETQTYNVATMGGHPYGGVKDLLFSTEANAALEFTIPANSQGFAIVTEVQTWGLTYNGVEFQPSTSVEVLVDEVLKETISMIPTDATHFQKRFDFVLEPSANTRKVKIVNKEANKWAFIWGIESWTDTCVRPINNAFAGASMFGTNVYNNYIKAYSPDLIIHEANLLNDTRNGVKNTEALYEAVYTKIKEDGYPLLVIVTHAPSESSESIGVNPDDDNKVFYPQYAAMIKRVCSRLDIPYINVFQYQYDIYNGIIPTDLFVDNIHLSAKGHDMYKKLINYVFENNY